MPACLIYSRAPRSRTTASTTASITANITASMVLALAYLFGIAAPLTLIANNALASSSPTNHGSSASELKTAQAKLSIAQRLARETPQDLNLQREVFTLLAHISNQQREQGDFQSAFQTNSQALAWVEKLLLQFPENATLLRDHSIARERNAVILQNQGRSQAALEEFALALRIAEQAQRLDSANPDYKNDLWLLQRQIAALHKHLQRPQSAIQYFRAALQALQTITPESAQHLRLTHKLWLAHSELGESLIQAEQFEAANQHLQQALQLAQGELALTKSDSENHAHWQDAIANSKFNLGEIALKQNQAAPNMQYFEDAQKIYQTLIKQHAAQPHWHTRLMQIQHHLARVSQGKSEPELAYLQTALKHALAAHDLDAEQTRGSVMQAYSRLAEYHAQQKQSAQAIVYWQEIIQKLSQVRAKNFDAQRDFLAELLGKIGHAHADLSQWKKAVEHYRQAIELRQALSQTHDQTRTRDGDFLQHQRIYLSRLQLSLGMSLAELQEYVVARQSFQHALKIVTELEKNSTSNTRWIYIRGLIWSNMGAMYMRTQEYASALEYLNKARAYFQKHDSKEINNHILSNHSIVEDNLGEVHYTQQAWARAAEHYAAALALSQRIPIKHTLQTPPDMLDILHNRAELHFKIGLVHQQRGQLATALSSLRLAEQQLEEYLQIHTKHPILQLTLARTRAQIASLPGASTGLDNASRRNLIFEAQETIDRLEKQIVGHRPADQRFSKIRQEFLNILRTIK